MAQKFKFPMEYLKVTQGELDSYSHAGSLAMDFGGKDTGADKLYCPCDMVVKRCRQSANGELYLESTLPVEFADGTTDYARLICIHDNAFNVVEGQVLKQGDYFYDEGGMGSGKANTFATHVHIEAGKGKWKSCTQFANAQGTFVIENQSHLYDLFILGDDVVILNDGGYPWKRVSDLNNNSTNKSIACGVDISAHQADATVEQLILGGKAEFVITRATIGSYTEDSKLKTFLPKIQYAGLKNSHYSANYCKNEAEAIEEANFICDTIESYGDKAEMPIFFDWEYFSADYIKENFGVEATPALVQAMAVAFCNKVIERGYKAGIYLNKDFWDRFYGDSFLNAHPEYYIWYARPGYSQPDKPCYLWQYASDNGADFGYNGDIDKNILMGDYTDNLFIEPMKPLSNDPIRMKIGYASSGDIHKLVTKLEGLGIKCDVADGYIITSEMSRGDQCYIMVDCNALGIPYEIYIAPQPEPEPENPSEEPEGDITVDKPENGDNEPNRGAGETTEEKESILVRIIKRILRIIFGGDD